MSGECFNEFQLTIKSLSPNLYFELTNCKGQSNQSWLKGNKTSTTAQIFICECGKSNESPSNYYISWQNLQKLNRLSLKRLWDRFLSRNHKMSQGQEALDGVQMEPSYHL